ncbi:MAG TPA: HPr family phosphocarrier protein [Micropruina sp.]|nr:HPr family phosphocarrier protein [Micropruina sp.]
MITRDVIITDPDGVHALVAQELATKANSYASSLYLRHNGRTASAGQPVSVLALGIRQGACITVLADGLDEAEALTALAEYLAHSAPTPPTTINTLTMEDPE